MEIIRVKYFNTREGGEGDGDKFGATAGQCYSTNRLLRQPRRVLRRNMAPGVEIDAPFQNAHVSIARVHTRYTGAAASVEHGTKAVPRSSYLQGSMRGLIASHKWH